MFGCIVDRIACIACMIESSVHKFFSLDTAWWLNIKNIINFYFTFSASTRGFCDEPGTWWLLWDTAVQNLCIHWWTHNCGGSRSHTIITSWILNIEFIYHIHLDKIRTYKLHIVVNLHLDIRTTFSKLMMFTWHFIDAMEGWH